MIVTVMSDASFYIESKASGYGVYIKSDRGFFQGGGNFKRDPQTNVEAEAMAIAVAVFIAFKSGIAARGDKIIMQTDCLTMINCYNGQQLYSVNLKKKKNHRIKETVKFTRKIIRENKCVLEFRHVKGHAGYLGNRNFANEICDSLAKQAARKIKEERKSID